jgi:hypothetical protein
MNHINLSKFEEWILFIINWLANRKMKNCDIILAACCEQMGMFSWQMDKDNYPSILPLEHTRGCGWRLEHIYFFS